MAPDPRLVQAVVQQATAAGMNPLDLLTIIGYETAGTYRADQPGPRTKWGQHRGLIQWGEPQAKQYQVDFTDPEQQVGAAIQYLRDHGWRPGMGRLEMYAAINAGHVSQVNASDVAAGGAPGTVTDKVTKQMGGHERTARNLLSAYDVPGGYQLPAGANANGIPGGVEPSSLPWGGGYTPAPQGVLSTDAPSQAPAPQTPPAAAVAPYSAAPNSDAARMLSDPTRYGLSPDAAQAMREQMAAGGPGGGTIGDIPVPQPDQPPASPQPPPAGVLSTEAAPASPNPAALAPPPGAQGTAQQLLTDWRKRQPPTLMQGGWT